MTSLILASSSPYRRELLARLQLPFAWQAPDIDETPWPGESPKATCQRLARAKAEAVRSAYPQHLIIGSDQVAERDGQAISKPIDHAAAVEQLTWASGRSLDFHTALCVLDSATGRSAATLVTVTTHYRHLSPEQIERYLDADQPYDCAGSTRIETLGITLVERVVCDDPTALIGLPLIALTTLLQNFGVTLP